MPANGRRFNAKPTGIELVDGADNTTDGNARYCFGLCVPKTLSALMRWQNRLSWPNDWAAMFIPCSRGLAIQVEEPT